MHEQDRAEAMRIIYRASFAHQKANVCVPTMAAYLIRNESRFIFSHTFKYCPLKDLIKLQDRKSVGAGVLFGSENKFFENKALHYMCRPVEFEDLHVKDFYERCEVVKCGRNTLDEECLFEFDQTYCQHPAWNQRTGKWAQKVKSRDVFGYIKG